MRIAWLFAVPSASYRHWTGTGTLSFDGADYDPGLLGADGLTLSLDGDPSPVVVTVPAGTTTDRTFWLTDRGHPAATVQMVYDDGSGWQAGPKLDATLGQPRMGDGTADVDVEVRPRSLLPARWDDTTQRARSEGDLGFSMIERWRSARGDLDWPRQRSK